MNSSALFHGRWKPLAFAAPQLLLLGLFFYEPLLKAAWWSLHLVRPFGHGSRFVGLGNYARVLSDPGFYGSLRATLVFALLGVGMATASALLLALLLEWLGRGAQLFRHVLIWPYAVAGSVLGVILKFAISPAQGPMQLLDAVWPGWWRPYLDGGQAMLTVALAFAWTQLPFDLIIFVAALRTIPGDYLAAAALDGAGPLRRFWDIQWPLLRPYLYFVLVVNGVDAFTHSFAIIDTLTQGGPGGATDILPYKIYSDGFVGMDLSGSSALSLILLLIMLGLVATYLAFFGRARRER